MQLSTRGRVAVMAMAELARREAAAAGTLRPVTLAEVAASQALSLSYLEQLFLRLRRAGLVGSARGPGGGYRLARPAGRISIAAIVRAVDDPARGEECEEAGGCVRGASREKAHCLTHALWAALEQRIEVFLAGVSLDDVVAGRVAAPPVAAE